MTPKKTCEITFQYYLEGSTVKPRQYMSDLLYRLIVAAVAKTGAVKCHIVHVGTYGDPRHRKRKSYHNNSPPDAIDVTKIYLWWADKSMILMMPKTSLAHRAMIAANWGGTAHHVDDEEQSHIHLDIEGAE